jgi:ketosteroid isomerase-like protein
MALPAFDQPELERFNRTFKELFDAADPDSMTFYYTEQAQLMADGIAPIRGHSAIGHFWRTAISRAKAAGARRTIQLHESHSSGDLGYALCTVTVEIPGGAPRTAWDRHRLAARLGRQLAYRRGHLHPPAVMITDSPRLGSCCTAATSAGHARYLKRHPRQQNLAQAASPDTA